MRAISWILPVAAMAASAGCIVTDGASETRSFTHSGFDSIDASSGVNVELSQGPFAITVEGPEGKLDKVIVEQVGSELRLSRKSEISWFSFGPRYVVRVTAPSLAKISASGGADVEASGLQLESLSLSASGGGDIEIKGVKVATLSASASGGGDIELEGSCGTATISTSGGGDFNGEDLDCATVTASASGGGDVDVRASLVANGDASSGGDIRFIGSPPTVVEKETSGGDVSVEAR